MKQLSREFTLLVLGAIISMGSSLCTTYLINSASDKKDLVAKKDAFVEKLSQEVELRLLLIHDLYNAKNDLAGKSTLFNKTTFDTALTRCAANREQFDAHSVYYIIEIKRYFNKKDADDFTVSIYNELIKLGMFVELNNPQFINKKTYEPHREQLESAVQEFMEHLSNEIN